MSDYGGCNAGIITNLPACEIKKKNEIIIEPEQCNFTIDMENKIVLKNGEPYAYIVQIEWSSKRDFMSYDVRVLKTYRDVKTGRLIESKFNILINSLHA